MIWARSKEAFELHGKQIAAIIVEPVPANNGLLLQTDEFPDAICDRSRKAAGALVIFDEVITGFRVGFGGMAERTGIRARSRDLRKSDRRRISRSALTADARI